MSSLAYCSSHAHHIEAKIDAVSITALSGNTTVDGGTRVNRSVYLAGVSNAVISFVAFHIVGAIALNRNTDSIVAFFKTSAGNSSAGINWVTGSVLTESVRRALSWDGAAGLIVEIHDVLSVNLAGLASTGIVNVLSSLSNTAVSVGRWGDIVDGGAFSFGIEPVGAVVPED